MVEPNSHISTVNGPKHDVHLDIVNEQGDDECIVTAADIKPENRYCTRAVTGCCPFFQEIYFCQTCCSQINHGDTHDEALPPCICFACVDECHSDHDIEYIGMGPCFCDCNEYCCKLYVESIDVANRLGFTMTNDNGQIQEAPLLMNNYLRHNLPTHSYIRDVYTIPALKENRFQDCLILQCKELVRLSKDTFWLDSSIVDASMQPKDSMLCELEYFAWNIFRQHVQHYVDTNEETTRGNKEQVLGAEWWVQVKELSPAEETAMPTDTKKVSNLEAIDLHYDKDEEMASMFGIGIFPFISTVTYLTESEYAPPTIIFSRRYDEVDDDTNQNGIKDMFVSHPRIAKHVAFDGRLLHGAPSHPLLRRQFFETSEVHCHDASITQSIRITFLVNIWLGYKPVGVNVLPVSIRAAIRVATIDHDHNANDAAIAFIQNAPAHEINLKHETDLPEYLRQKIDLPFVGGKAIWGGVDDDDDDTLKETEGNAMVLATYPPPPAPNCDTMLVVFAPDLAPMFKYDD